MKKILIAIVLLISSRGFSQNSLLTNSIIPRVHETVNVIDMDSLYIKIDNVIFLIDTSDIMADTGLFEITWIGSDYLSDSFYLVEVTKVDASLNTYILLFPKKENEESTDKIKEGDIMPLIVKRLYNIILPKQIDTVSSKLCTTVNCENSLYLFKTNNRKYRIRCSFLHRLIATSDRCGQIDDN